MGKSDMFAVRGITLEARRTAKSAAAADGKRLGEWLCEAIAMWAIEQGARRGIEGTREAHRAKKVAETVANKDARTVYRTSDPPPVPHVGTVFEYGATSAVKDEDGLLQVIPAVIGEYREGPEYVPPKQLHPEARAKKAPKGKKQCQHGTAKGENCWKCGGLARVE